MSAGKLLVTVCLVLFLSASGCKSDLDPLVASTQAFVAAFNAQDATGMGKLAHPEIEWLNASGSALEVGTAGREALLAEMRAYFGGDFTTHSELLDPVRRGQFVTATEAASWRSDGQVHRQCSIVLYEYEETLIRRVTYYPAWPC